jgi:hypothetical protein
MEATEAPPQSGNGTVTKTGWKKLTVHSVWCPTGARVKIRFPNMSALFRSNALPTELVHVAFMDKFAPDMLRQIIGDADKEAELLRNFDDLQNRLVVDMLVEPKLTLGELHQVPQEDLEMLKEIAMRERDTDARGVRLGVVSLDAFQTFREAHEGSEDVAEGHPPFPDPSCRACQQAMREFSSLGELLL